MVSPTELQKHLDKDEYLGWLKSLLAMPPEERRKSVAKRMDRARKTDRKKAAASLLQKRIDTKIRRLLHMSTDDQKHVGEHINELGRLVLLHSQCKKGVSALNYRLKNPPESRLPVIEHRIAERQTFLTRRFIIKKVAKDRLRLRQANAFWGPLKHPETKETEHEPGEE